MSKEKNLDNRLKQIDKRKITFLEELQEKKASEKQKNNNKTKKLCSTLNCSEYNFIFVPTVGRSISISVFASLVGIHVVLQVMQYNQHFVQ